MTRRMLELVKAEEWEQVAELAGERHELLLKGAGASDPESAQRNIGILQEIQRLDQEIERLGRQGREHLKQQLRQFQTGRKAGKAYRS